MAKRVYAKRYSQAVFYIALEAKELDRWHADLRKIADLGEDAAITFWLQNPKLHFDDKAKLISEQLRDINPLVLNLVYLLITKGRFDIIGDIADEYQRLLDSYRGIEQAEVVTTIPLDDAEKLILSEQLGSAVGKKVMVKSEVDPSLIGGIMVRVGGKLMDGSTRNKLAALKKELAGPVR